jgi:hypothetical protein
VLYGWLLDNNSHRGESLADLSYPLVLVQGGKGGSNCFIKTLRRYLNRVLNVLDILDLAAVFLIKRRVSPNQ